MAQGAVAPCQGFELFISLVVSVSTQDGLHRFAQYIVVLEVFVESFIVNGHPAQTSHNGLVGYQTVAETLPQRT
ncbi:MAG: uncharacterized protein KVP18_001366 [Porospora cf. gigantea A]|uniref:uncharacterized protein n=1 Tax=Porospora cf. gigantea A TaxID=2853593 RepID=UPI003559735E|nr:MAG: hypothetical protein KVP18_001366 [Porospora cf. gigantea A]